MKQTFLFLALLAAGSGAHAALLPGDAAKGKAVHDTQCVACHDSGVYTRANRRIKSVEGLIGQVNTCNRQLDKRLDREQINDLVKYLSDTYYHFP